MLSKLWSKLRQEYTFHDVLSMYDKGAFEDAYTALCDVMKNQPQWSKDGGVYTLWAELELLVNDNACRAIELLDRAREVGCSEMGYYYSIYADAMLRLGNCEKAVHNYEQSVAIDPSVSNLTMLAQALSMMNHSRAVYVWRQVLQKDPDNCLAHVHLGLEAVKSGDRAKGLIMAKRAERLDPSVEDVYMIGYLYHDLEQFQSALNAYQEADRCGYADKALLYASIAACYLSLGQAGTARKYAEWAVRFNPEDDYAKEVWQIYQERYGQ